MLLEVSYLGCQKSICHYKKYNLNPWIHSLLQDITWGKRRCCWCWNFASIFPSLSLLVDFEENKLGGEWCLWPLHSVFFFFLRSGIIVLACVECSSVYYFKMFLGAFHWLKHRSDYFQGITRPYCDLCFCCEWLFAVADLACPVSTGCLCTRSLCCSRLSLGRNSEIPPDAILLQPARQGCQLGYWIPHTTLQGSAEVSTGCFRGLPSAEQCDVD